MRIREITLQEVRMKLVDPFETSMDRTNVRRILLVQADVDGVIGWAECVAGEDPFYSPETADTAWLILRDFLWPLIKGQGIRLRRRSLGFAGACSRAQHGQGFTGSCRLGCRSQTKGACRFQNSLEAFRDEIACGVSIGIKESLDEPPPRCKKNFAAGYQRIKIKIKPGKILIQCDVCARIFRGINCGRRQLRLHAE